MTRTARPIVLAEQAAPATPSSGFGAIYFKTDGTLYYKNDAGTEVALVAAGAPTYPLLAGTGTLANPQYSFAADVDTGMFLNGVGDLRLAASGSVGSFGAAVTIVDDGTNGSTSIFGRGTGQVNLLIGAFSKFKVINAELTATVPHRGADGTAAAPTYSFTNDVDTGMRLNSVGILGLTVGGQDRFVGSDDGTNGSVTINGGRGSGALGLQFAGVNRLVYFAGVWSMSVPLWGQNVRYTEAAAPGTPTANMVVTYAKADGLMYSMDDTGVERLMSGGDTDDTEFMAMWGAFG